MTANSAEVIRFPVRPDNETGRIEVDYLSEPFLLFADAGLHVDPKSGIDRYGPRSYGTSLHPKNVRVGIIGTAELSETAQTWMARNAVGVAGDETNRSFPGFAPDRGFFSSLSFDDGWNATVSLDSREAGCARLLCCPGSDDTMKALVTDGSVTLRTADLN